MEKNIITSSSSSRSNNEKNAKHVERYGNANDKMTELYTILHSMVPNLPPKAQRMKIVDQTISYIKSLEQITAKLESEKKLAKELLQSTTTTNSTVTVSVSGKTAFFGIRLCHKCSLLTQLVAVFDKYRAEILTATIAKDGEFSSITVTALLCEIEDAGRIKLELMSI